MNQSKPLTKAQREVILALQNLYLSVSEKELTESLPKELSDISSEMARIEKLFGFEPFTFPRSPVMPPGEMEERSEPATVQMKLNWAYDRAIPALLDAVTRDRNRMALDTLHHFPGDWTHQ